MLPGSAMDIGVGANGQMWVIGTNTEGGGYGIYRWTGRKYNKIAGSATRVSVDKDGNAWVVNKHRQIYYYNGSRWLRQPGAAYDIGCGAEGTHWVVGTNALARGGYGIYRKATGASRTVFSTNSQGALNWKRGVRWTMSFRYNSVVIMGNNVQAWSTGRFPCTNMMTLTNDGNLQASCNGKKITWQMGLGKKGPISSGAIKITKKIMPAVLEKKIEHRTTKVYGGNKSTRAFGAIPMMKK